jgi:hypothetical protein
VSEKPIGQVIHQGNGFELVMFNRHDGDSRFYELRMLAPPLVEIDGVRVLRLSKSDSFCLGSELYESSRTVWDHEPREGPRPLT